jgi:pyruvate formate lyase activating enzyme
MEIGGFEPFSLCDFPSRPAAVVFTQGCNFRCPFCHNGELLALKAGTIPAAEVLDRLAQRRGLLQGVVVSGGEPCLQADLAEFCASVKAMGLAVKLDTNGSRPAVLADLLARRLVDYVAMDVKAPPRLYANLAGAPVEWNLIAESIRILAASGVPHQFRTTVVGPLLGDEDLDEIASLLPPGSRHVRQQSRAELARDSHLRAATGPVALIQEIKTSKRSDCVHSS